MVDKQIVDEYFSLNQKELWFKQYDEFNNCYFCEYFDREWIEKYNYNHLNQYTFAYNYFSKDIIQLLNLII